MPDLLLLAATIGIAILVWLATGVVRRLLLRWQVLDRPNVRSSHQMPTPRGGLTAAAAGEASPKDGDDVSMPAADGGAEVRENAA